MNHEGWSDGESTVSFRKDTELAISKKILEVLMSIGIFLSFSFSASTISRNL